MPLDIKTRKNNLPALERAARLRANDFDNERLTKKDEDTRISTFLKRRDYRFQPGILPNQPMSSHQQREFLRDTRFFISLNNMELTDLERELDNLITKNLNSIQRIQKDAEALDSATLEEEIRFYKHYDQVHYNAFTREKDMALEDTDRWMTDYKTELGFENSQKLNVIEGTGVTLPIGDRLVVPFIDAHLVGEETDVGDTAHPIIATEARNVILPDEVFRWVIIRREHDNTTRHYNRTPSRLCFLLDLPGIQLINWLKVIPAAGSSLLVDSIVYINEANEEIELESVEIDSDTGPVFLFEPVRARQMKVRFIQYAPIMKIGRDHGNLEVRELNRMLEGLSWHNRIDETSEYIEGRVFDFSIREIKTGLNTYLGTGIFRSKDVRIRNIASAAIGDQVDLVPITSGVNASGQIAPELLPGNDAFSEYYLGVDLENAQGKRILRDLVPIPDTYPVQVEFLPLIGQEGRVKLMPDLLWNLGVNRVVGSSVANTQRLNVTTAEAHGFVVGDAVGFVGPADSPLIGSWEVVQVDGEFTFRIQLDFPAVDVETILENTTPRFYAYLDDPEVNDIDIAPIRVYKDGVEIFIGSDYQLNFGVGDNWQSSFPRGVSLSQALEDARSGKCRVRILNPDYDAVYWIEYRPLPNQFLGKTKLVRLQNGRVVFDRKFRRSRGTINTIAILRGDSGNPYLTPVLRNYSLRLRKYK